MRFLFFFALLITNILTAQVVYTDPEPDILFNGHTAYGNVNLNKTIDLNNDGIDDISFYEQNSWVNSTITLTSLSGGLEWVINGTYPDTLNLGDEINSNLLFSSTQKLIGYSEQNIPKSGLFAYASSYKYLGLKMIVNNKACYGWIRYAWGEDKIFDYAIDTSGNSIFAGQGILPFVKSISVTDVANNRNASDIKVDFKKPANSKFINHYRLFIVPESAFPGFTQNYAEQLDSTRSNTVLNTANESQTVLFPSNILDTNGDTIKEYINYYCFVLSYTDSNLNKTQLLSAPSNLFFLSSVCSSVKNTTLSAQYNADLHYLLNLKFDTLDTQSGIKEYRIYFFDNNLFSGNIDSLYNSSSSFVKMDVHPLNYNFLLYSDTVLLTNHLPVDRKRIHYIVISVPDGLINNKISSSTVSNSVTLKTYSPVVKISSVNDLNSTDGNTQLISISPTDSTFSQTVKLYLTPFNLMWRANEDSLRNGNYIFSKTYTVNNQSAFLFNRSNGVTIYNQVLWQGYPLLLFLENLYDTLKSDVSSVSYYHFPVEFSDNKHLTCADSSIGNILYIDFVPDSVIPFEVKETNYLELDLNQDQINDIRVIVYHNSSPSFEELSKKVIGINGSQIACYKYGTYLVADTLLPNVQLNEFFQWQNTAVLLYSFISILPNSDINYGVWKGSRFYYLGVRVPKSGNYVYGWIRMNPFITIDSYALQNAPTSFNQVDIRNDVSIYPNPTSDKLFIRSFKEKILSVELLDVVGKSILVSNESDLDISEVPTGTYILLIETDHKKHIRKMVKKN